MCTLVLAAQIFDGHPLVVVANRDERLDRASSPPFVWPEGFLAPRDDVAGGTWLGVNRAGVFVGITNRYLGPQDPTRTSRGAIVKDALALGSARAIHDAMARVPPGRHNGFHLVVADAHDVLATASDGASLVQLVLGRGLHTVTERSFGAGDDTRRRARIDDAWQRLVGPPAQGAARPLDLERLSQLLTDHDEGDPLGATCIHLQGIPYGTRSGAAIAIASKRGSGVASRMLWAEGPPCTTRFAPVSGFDETR
ncbi:NRDE family protein [soil metagenome]